MRKSVKKLPGAGVRIISFIPTLNCFALVYIGSISGNWVNLLCGWVYFFISVAVPNISPLFWMVGIIHYAVAYSGVQKQMMATIAQKTASSSTAPTYKNQSQSRQKFSEVTLPGSEERTQSIPTPPISSTPSVTMSYSYETSQSKFFRDMKKYENRISTAVPFEPFMTNWPTYESMSKDQQNWYFYWRSEVRKQNYIQADISYIFIYIYELLSGVGYLTPQDGYDQLIAIWQAYREKFPKLDGSLHSWIFDFAMIHTLEYTEIVSCDSLRLMPSVKTDMLIDRHHEDSPLKLPFELVDALCDYSLTDSKFYKEGNQALMQEAIPRVVALADAVLRKQKSKGILDIYGPNRTKKQDYYAFKSAVCPWDNHNVSISVKAYSTNQKLRGYINELVRYAENSLRALYGCRGRLRGVTLNEETAKFVDAFLKKEYGKAKKDTFQSEKMSAVELDFANIEALREQSNSVRSALLVEDAVEVVQKELLTNVMEVTAIFAALSISARNLLDQLQTHSWECKKFDASESDVASINRLAEHYLGCSILAIEGEHITVEDDYRDELDFIYQNPPAVNTDDVAQENFNFDDLNENLREVVMQLVPEHRKTLCCIVAQENVQERLDQIAEQAFTMPQILIDDINEVSMQTIGDILISSELTVTEEYAVELKNSMIKEKCYYANSN